MIVSLEKLTQAMNKVRKFAEGRKDVPGVMLDISTDKMKICYSDGKKSVIEIIDILSNDENFSGKVIVPYVRITGVIDACQPSGPVFTSDVQLTLGEDGILTVRALKRIKVAAGEDVEDKVISKFEQKLNYYSPDASIQYQVISRMDYNSIFSGESFDVWEKADLVEALARTSGEKGKTVYVSGQSHIAFVANTASVTVVPLKDCEKHGFSVPTLVSGSLVDMINKFPGEKVLVHVSEGRYANISSEDNTVGIWFEMVAANRMDLASLQKYQEKAYSKYNLVFCRPALLNILDCAIKADNNEKTTLTFFKEAGQTIMRIVSAGNGGSTFNDFSLVSELCLDADKDIDNAKIPVSLKSLYDMISNCNEYYVSLAFDVEANNTFIRVGDAVDITESNEVRLGIMHYTTTSR